MDLDRELFLTKLADEGCIWITANRQAAITIANGKLVPAPDGAQAWELRNLIERGELAPSGRSTQLHGITFEKLAVVWSVVKH